MSQGYGYGLSDSQGSQSLDSSQGYGGTAPSGSAGGGYGGPADQTTAGTQLGYGTSVTPPYQGQIGGITPPYFPPPPPPPPANLSGGDYTLNTTGPGSGTTGTTGGSTSSDQYGQCVQQVCQSTQTVMQTQQQITNTINQYYQNYNQTLQTIQKYIIEQITQYIQKARDCTCNCLDSITIQQQGPTAPPPQTTTLPTSPLSSGTPPPPPVSSLIGGPGAIEVYQPPDITINIPPPIPVVPPQTVPTGPTPTQKPCYDIWCNSITGIVLVTNCGQGPLGEPGWNKVAGNQASDKVDFNNLPTLCKPQQQQDEGGDGTTPGSTGSQLDLFYGETTQCSLQFYCGPFAGSGLISKSQAFITDAKLVSEGQAILEGSFALLDSIPLSAAVTRGIKALLFSQYAFIEKFSTQLAGLVAAGDPGYDQLITLLATVSGMCNQAGIDSGPITQAIRYTLQARHPQEWLNPDGATAAYLAEAIDYDSWLCLMNMNNMCNSAAYAKLAAERSKPVPLELAIQRRRKLITAEQYDKGMRQLGYLEAGTVDNLFAATEQRPTVTDLVRFMVRDADDKSIVDSLELDALFGDKAGPTIKNWAADIGLTEEQLRYQWRSHWANIPPATLFTFWQRLRRNPDFGNSTDLKAKIRRGLIHDDINPTWFDAFFAIQYQPLGRIDLRRGFNVGALTEKELNDGLAQIGYSDDDCDRLTKVTKKLKRQAVLNGPDMKRWINFETTGDQTVTALEDLGYTQDDAKQLMTDAEWHFTDSPPARAFVNGDLPGDQLYAQLTQWGVSEAGANSIRSKLGAVVKTTIDVARYTDGFITRGDAETALASYGMADSRLRFLLDAIDDRIKNAGLQSCLKGIRKRFALGELRDAEAVAAIESLGLTNERARTLTNIWGCDQNARGKQPAISVLCNWLAKGQISSMDFVNRLARLGYSHDDAMLLLTDCLTKINEGLAKKAKQEAEQQARQQAKQQAAQQRAIAATNRALLASARNLEKAQVIKKRRERMLLSAADHFQKKCLCDLATAMNTIKQLKSELASAYRFSEDQQLQVLLTAAETWNKADAPDFVDHVLANAELLATTEVDSDLVAAGLIPTVNGTNLP